ncbi:Ulp1 protease family, C-terminal catalytic domain [Cinara cedri]|uniref:Ulp1 protease family, C-terminal catalytic domain n=1 Tax=Cinara cedri TaxID=506608 RepID=A0A5E4LZT7_9HEMI|nr:Ulp1 protease family, C-terminal catalytic domain [Cinara cedri]
MNNNKRVCMDNSFVKFNDGEEEVEINERRIPNVLLKANSPNMLDGIHNLNTKIIDEENKTKTIKSQDLLKPPIISKPNKSGSDEIQVGGMNKNLAIESHHLNTKMADEENKTKTIKSQDLLKPPIISKPNKSGSDEIQVGGMNKNLAIESHHLNTKMTDEENKTKTIKSHGLLKPPILLKPSKFRSDLMQVGGMNKNLAIESHHPNTKMTDEENKTKTIKSQDLLKPPIISKPNKSGSDEIQVGGMNKNLAIESHHPNTKMTDEENKTKTIKSQDLLKPPIISKPNKSGSDEIQGLLKPPILLKPSKFRSDLMQVGGMNKNLAIETYHLNTKMTDEENKTKTIKSQGLLKPPVLLKPSKFRSDLMQVGGMIKNVGIESGHKEYSFIGPKQLSLGLEREDSTLKISDAPINNSNNEILPKVETIETPVSNWIFPLNNHKEHVSNQSNFSTSSKNCVHFPELEFSKNIIIKHPTLYEDIFKIFTENKSSNVILNSSEVKLESPDAIFNDEKLETMNKKLNKIKPLILPPEAKDVLFPGFSKDVLEFINFKMTQKPKEQYITASRNIKIMDLQTVWISNGWLNDEVINHYINMIVQRNPKSIYAFDIFFYTKLNSDGFQAACIWTRKKDIFKYKKILIPIHLSSHWCLICVNFLDKTIKYYDSLRGSNLSCLNTIFSFLQEEYKTKKNEIFDCSGWQLIKAHCPVQLNGNDCGVFTCINAECIARDADLNFTQKDIPKLRYRICYEILTNKLCY